MKTFNDYKQHFYQHLKSITTNISRFDLCFDQYLDNSLKSTTRQKRGSSATVRFRPNNEMPKSWHMFLNILENKRGLFVFLAAKDEHFVCNPYQDVIVTTLDTSVLLHSASTEDLDLSLLTLSNHEEADTWIFLHCQHASVHGMKYVMISTVDSDVLVLVVHFFDKLNFTELWIKFGVGINKKCLAVHEIATSLGPEICLGLTFFHAWTGCDTTSAFENHGKKSHWSRWMDDSRVSKTFQKLSLPTQLDDNDCKELEIFELQVYNRGRTEESIDIASVLPRL